MRQDCCRICGNEMQAQGSCVICHDFTILHCPKCGKTSDPQIHTHKTK